MNGLSGIRNINNANRVTPAVRYQRQYKGNQWAVFDAHTGGFGFKSDDVTEVDARVDELNAQYALRPKPVATTDPLAVNERQDVVGALLATSAKAAA